MGILSGNERLLLFQEQTVSGGCALEFPDPQCQISYETFGLLFVFDIPTPNPNTNNIGASSQYTFVYVKSSPYIEANKTQIVDQ